MAASMSITSASGDIDERVAEESDDDDRTASRAIVAAVPRRG